MKIYWSNQIQSELINLCKKQNVNVWVEEKIRHAHFTFDASKSMTNFQTLHFSQLNQLYI